jgi:SAM-dependent methyltransferase
MATANIGPKYHHLVKRWLDRLVADGALGNDTSAYVAPSPLAAPDLPALWVEGERLFADNTALFAYFKHCATLSARVLKGEESPLETLFPGGSFDLAEGLYERSTTMRYINGLAGAAFEAMVAATARGGGRALRVLEVGAGTGGTTSSLLPLLPADRTRYTFTDVSDLFLDRARSRFAAFPFLECRRFDVDQDPAAQGYTSGSFDIIVSANAVHASMNLRRALTRLLDLLSPGGLLVLVESTTHLDWFDLTTGLIEGWQHFADDLREDNPLLTPAVWVGALEHAGFAEAGAWPKPGSPADHLGQHVIAARAPGDAAGGHLELDSAKAADPTTGAAAAEPRNDGASAFRAKWEATLPSERQDLLRDFVRDRVMYVLRLDASSPPGRHERLMDLGFDSLMAVQLRNVLTTGLGLDRSLPVSTMFDYPTIDALAARLLALLPPGEGATTESVETTSPVVASPAAPAASTIAAETVAAMSDAEIEQALLKRLGVK